MLKSLIGTVLKVRVLKEVNLFIVIAVVGIDKLVIVGLAEVNHTFELTVDIFYHLHSALHIKVNARALDDGGQGGIHKTGVVLPDIVATITQKEGLVTDVGFLWEEGIVEAVLSVENLVRLQFHRTGIYLSCPSARDADIHILVKKHTLRRTDITEIHRTVPVLIPVGRIVTSITCDTIFPHDVYAPHRISEVFLIADDGDDGNSIVGIGLDITSGDGHTGQITVFEETEHIVGGLVDGEQAVVAYLTGSIAGGGRHAAIGGVHQGCALRYLHQNAESVLEDLATLIDNRLRQSVAGKYGCGIRGTGCRHCRPSPLFAAIGLTGVSGPAQGFGVVLTHQELAILVTQIDSATVAVKLEGCLVAFDIIRTEPHDQESFCRHRPYAAGHPPPPEAVCIVAQIHATQVDILITWIIEFYPTVEVGGGTHHLAGIGGHQFINN